MRNIQLVDLSVAPTDSTPFEKLCIACGSKLPLSATLCSECGSFQATWKNSARFVANVIGIASVVIAVITYVIGAFPQLRRVLAWNDNVRILAFDQQSYAFANEGDGEVFLSHVYMRSPAPRGAEVMFIFDHQLLQRTVAPGSIISNAFDPNRPQVFGDIVHSVSPEQWEELYGVSVAFGYEGCIRRRVFSQSDATLNAIRDLLGKRFRTFPVEAELHYYSVYRRSMQQVRFDAVGLLTTITSDPKCRRDR